MEYPQNPQEPVWLHRAMKSVSEKAAYLELFQHDPTLLHEVGPELFLDAEQGNELRAAKRIARFWDERKAAFGDRAYRRLLDTSSEGALNDQDLEHIRKGALVITGADHKGRPILLNDGGIQTKADVHNDTFLPTRIKAQFYWICKAALEYPQARIDGYIFIKKMYPEIHGAQRRAKLPELLHNIYPIRVHSKYMCGNAASRGEVRTFKKLLFPLFPRLTADAIHVIKETPAEIGRELLKHGIPIETLPPALGGTWSYDAVNNRSNTPHQTIERKGFDSLQRSSQDIKRKIQDAHDKHRDTQRKPLKMLPVPPERQPIEPILTWNPTTRRKSLKKRMDQLFRRNRTVKVGE